MVENTIIVGLDGSPSAWQALDWAADEARRTGRALLLVHAVQEADRGSGSGTDLLAVAAARLASGPVVVGVDSVLRVGDAATVLVQLGADAVFLVVGAGAHGLRPVRIGSVTDAVLAAAQSPTVVVGTPRDPRPNLVAVGASASLAGAAALDFACREALRRGAAVKLVRSWSIYERRRPRDGSRALTSPDVWRAEEQSILDRSVAFVRREYPTLSVGSAMSGEPVEVALERASLDAALLVVGRRGDNNESFPGLGPIAKWSVHHLDCPVAVVGGQTTGRVAPQVQGLGRRLKHEATGAR